MENAKIERLSTRIEEITVEKLEADSATAMAAGRADHGVTLLEKALDLAMQARDPPFYTQRATKGNYPVQFCVSISLGVDPCLYGMDPPMTKPRHVFFI